MIMASSRKLEKEDPEPSIDRLLSISDRTAAEIKNLPEKGTQKQKHFVCLDAEELLIPLLENESLQQAHNEQFQKFVLACSMNLSMVSGIFEEKLQRKILNLLSTCIISQKLL